MRNRIRMMALQTGLLLVVVLCCTTPVQLTGGSSSETVVGRVVHGDGSPACSAVVTLYPVDYNPVADSSPASVTKDTTDSSGKYSITAPDSAAQYTIVATSLDSGTRALVTGIVANGETTNAPEAVLTVPGAIQVAVPDSVSAAVDGYVYIPGTDIVAFVAGSSTVLLSQVPAGEISSVNYGTGTAPEAANVLVADVEVVSGDTVVIPYPRWRYFVNLYLNTSASGAGVSGDVADFPVCVRLSSANFDFTQARPAGEDLRFAGADGTPLLHEIERWDASAAAAAVWVRVPMVRGDNDSQFIVMYWGAQSSDVPSRSNGAGVFDTSNGFEAVWHLSGAGDDVALDATANGRDGTPYNMTIASAVKGAIGNARSFDGKTEYITIPNSASGNLDMPQNGEYSISLWAYADTIDTLWHAIAGKGHEQYYLKLKCFKNGKATWEFVEFQDQRGWEYTEDSIPPAPGTKQWVYLTGVRSGLEQYLYINGALVNDSTPLMAGEYPRNSSDNFTIGRHARQVTIPYSEGWCYFDGKIDEVRVMSTAPNSHWIKLCYMNQKAGDALVVFGK